VNEGGSGCSIFGNGAVDTKRKIVYYGTGQNNEGPVSDLQDSIFALNYLTGEFLWKKLFVIDDIGEWPAGDCFYSGGSVKNWDTTAAQLDTLCIDGKKKDVVIVPTKEGKLYILDRESETQEGVVYHEHVIVSPAPTGSSNQGINYPGCTDGKYYYFLAFYSTNGQPIGITNAFNPAPFININTALLKVEPKTGAIVWRTEFVGSVVSPPTYANGVVYFTTLIGPKTSDLDDFGNPIGYSLYAVDACTGEANRLRFRGNLLEGDVVTGGSIVTIKDGSIYFGDSRGIYSYSLSGKGNSCHVESSVKSVSTKDVKQNVDDIKKNVIINYE